MSEIRRVEIEEGGDIAIRGDGTFVYYTDHAAEIARLRAEVEALRVDAERYRWLRDRAGIDDGEVEVFIDSESWAHGYLDAQIDEAMGADA